MRRIVLLAAVGLLATGLTGVCGTALALTDMETLGESIFFDGDLSLNKNQSCAACHAPAVGWTGPDEAINMHGAVYEGSTAGRFGDRKPPASAYATTSPIFHLAKQKGGTFAGGNFWDGRATGEKLGNPAADQAQGPFLNPLEQALPDSACVVYRVCTATTYPVSLEQVWPGACNISWPSDVETQCALEYATVALSAADRTKSNTAYDYVALAIAAYEASSAVNAFTSKYDAVVAGQTKFTKLEQEGFNLFWGRGKCNKCHTVNPRGQQALFTDYTYDNLGVPRNPENPFYGMTVFNPQGAAWIDPGLGGFLATRMQYAQFAHMNYGKHKVPTLRNVDKRPSPDFVKAYSHNGFFKSLKGIVHFYNTRDVLPVCPDSYGEAQALAANCWPLPELALNMNTKDLGNLGLSDAEEDALVAFMQTLSDGWAP